VPLLGAAGKDAYRNIRGDGGATVAVEQA